MDSVTLPESSLSQEGLFRCYVIFWRMQMRLIPSQWSIVQTWDMERVSYSSASADGLSFPEASCDMFLPQVTRTCT